MTPGLPPAAAAYVNDYLADLERHLPGGARLRRDTVDEVRDGLLELLEPNPPGSRRAAAATVTREFGDPATVGAALAGELRLRLARRHAFSMLALLLAAGLGWYGYRTAAGVPVATLPAAGWPRTVFLASVDLLPIFVTAAQLGTALLALALSVRLPRAAGDWLPVALAGITFAALAGFLATSTLMLITTAPGQHLYAAAVAAPFAAVMLAAAGSAHRTVHHLRPSHPSRPSVLI